MRAGEQERAEKGPKLAVPEVVPGAVQPGFSSAAYVAYAGPGLLVAAAYVDPGSIEAALASGTFFGETPTCVGRCHCCEG